MSSKRTKENNFIIQGGILAVTSVLVRMIGIIYRIPMTRIIGDEGMGYYESAFEVYNLAFIVSSFSLPTAVSKLVADRTAKHQPKNSFRVFLASLIFALVSGSFVALLVYFGADFISSVMFKDPFVGIPLKMLAPTLFICTFLGVFRGFFQGKHTMIPTAVSQLVEQIINGVVSVSAAYFLMKEHSASESIAAYGASGGTLGTGVGAFFGLIFLVFVFILYIPTLKKHKKKSRHESMESYSMVFQALILTIIPVVLGQLIFRSNGIFSRSIFGNVMTAKGVSKEVISSYWGVYGNKYRLLTNVPIAIASAVSAAMIPSITMVRAQGSMGTVKYKIATSIKFNMLIAIPSAVGMAVLASPILQLVFHDSNKLPAQLLAIGSIAIVFYSLSTVSNAVLQSINLMRLPVIHCVISLAVDMLLIYLLLQFANLGVYALVIGNVIFPMLVCIMNWIAIARNLHYRQEILKTFLIPIVCSAFMGLVVFLVYMGFMKLFHISAIGTILSILIGVIIYFFTLILLRGVSEEELERMPKGHVIVRIARKLHVI